ncbi:MAG: hypothetical protein LBG61_00495 [Burkholderiales bacterium]|jgi:hypothetical protein|nr:hypothetical protein [Burkholderiales bacterium]
MSKCKWLYLLIAVASTALLSGCFGDNDDITAEPVTKVDYTVAFQGPGGHSQGNYGRTNALHAAARAVVALENAGVDFYLKDIHGGNSVNAIASDGYITVGLLKGDEAAFETAVKAAAEAGMNEENAFRNVSTDQIDNTLRVDIRIESIPKQCRGAGHDSAQQKRQVIKACRFLWACGKHQRPLNVMVFNLVKVPAEKTGTRRRGLNHALPMKM